MRPTQRTRALRALEQYLALRHAAQSTVETYMGAARRFIDHVDKPPARVTRQDVEDYLLDLRARGMGHAVCNIALDRRESTNRDAAPPSS